MRAILATLLLPVLLLVVGCGSNNSSTNSNTTTNAQGPKGTLVVEQITTVAPEYQDKPIRVSCPGSTTKDINLCQQAFLFSRSSQKIKSANKQCPIGSASWQVKGTIDGKRISASFDDCNKTDWEQLRQSIVAYFGANNSALSEKQSLN